MHLYGGVIDRLHRTYNKPTCDEVAAIMVDGTDSGKQPYVAMNTKGGVQMFSASIWLILSQKVTQERYKLSRSESSVGAVVCLGDTEISAAVSLWHNWLHAASSQDRQETKEGSKGLSNSSFQRNPSLPFVLVKLSLRAPFTSSHRLCLMHYLCIYSTCFR